jgi:Gpi16 subunit, GPI transamidase component
MFFTQGRWNYESDSLSNTDAKPPGIELWTLFDAFAKEGQNSQHEKTI